MSEAADTLVAHSIIKSPFIFKAFVMFMSGHRQVQAGDYLFDQPQSAVRVAYRMIHGIQGLPKIKVTVFEGMTVKDIGALLLKNIPAFDVQTFVAAAKPYEGYLFPDTYFFYQNTTPQEVIDTLRMTFNQKMQTIMLSAQAFGKPMSEIIAMASIIEREAASSTDRRIIAGILWKRIADKMPLQVDPPFYYFLNKDSSQLTVKDLSTDSPYNLYKHIGLPPTPINNPGLDTIIDTITPTATKYWFYLSDKNGVMHYAATYEGHMVNKRKYVE